MGAYLRKPITKKVSESGEYVYCGRKIMYASSAMQGWRVAMEDAHSAVPEYDEDSSLFAVYDGHGGKEVAVYCSMKLGDIIKSMDAYGHGDIDKALKDAFLHCDEMLLWPDVIRDMKQIAESDIKDDSDLGGENIEELMNEATMPMQSLLTKYGPPDIPTQLGGHLDPDPDNHIVAGSQETNVKSVLQLLCSNAGLKIDFEDSENSGSDDSGSEEGGSEPETDNEDTPSQAKTSPASLTQSSGDDTKQSSREHTLNSKEAAVSDLKDSGEKDSISDSPLTNLLGAKSQEKVIVSSTEQSTKDETSNSVPVSSPILSSEETPLPTTSPSKICGDMPSSTPTSASTPLAVVACDQESEQAKEVPSISVSTCGSLGVKLSNNSSSFKSQTLASESKCPPSTNCDSNPSDSVISKTKSSEITSADLRSNLVSSGLSQLFNNKGSLPVVQPMNPVSPTKSRGLKELLTTGMEDRYPTDELAMFLEANEVCLSTGSRKRPHPKDDDVEDDADIFAQRNLPKRQELVSDYGYHSGTTAVVCLLKGNNIFVANSGDSRCIMSSKGVVVELSFDHKPTDPLELERIERAGGKVGKDGRVNGGLNLSRALGDHFYKEFTSLPLKDQMISCLPDVVKATLDDDVEFIVLACDGIWNSKTSQEVVDFVRFCLLEKAGNEPTQKDLVTICEALCDACMAPDTDNDGTGCDNMTCILVLLKSLSTGTRED